MPDNDRGFGKNILEECKLARQKRGVNGLNMSPGGHRLEIILNFLW